MQPSVNKLTIKPWAINQLWPLCPFLEFQHKSPVKNNGANYLKAVSSD